jgi:hypothetical protein
MALRKLIQGPTNRQGYERVELMEVDQNPMGGDNVHPMEVDPIEASMDTSDNNLQFGRLNILTFLAASAWLAALLVALTRHTGLASDMISIDKDHGRIFRYSENPPGVLFLAAVFLAFVQLAYIMFDYAHQGSKPAPVYRGWNLNPILLTIVYLLETASIILYADLHLWASFYVSLASYVVTSLTYIRFLGWNKRLGAIMNGTRDPHMFFYAEFFCLNLPIKALEVHTTFNMVKILFAAARKEGGWGMPEDNACAIAVSVLTLYTLYFNLWSRRDALYGLIFGLHLANLARIQQLNYETGFSYTHYLPSLLYLYAILIAVSSALAGFSSLSALVRKYGIAARGLIEPDK